MPTTEERLTALETAMADAQTKILLRATSLAVSEIEQSRDNVQDETDARILSVEERLAKLERSLAVINQSVGASYKKNQDEELAEDVVFTNSTRAPVLKDTNGASWRVKVSTGGSLSTEVVV